MHACTMGLRRIGAVLAITCASPLAALAGPPLSIDDPEILDTGSFEVIVAAAIDSRDSGDSYLFPILDVSYGLSENIQLAAVASRINNDPDDGARRATSARVPFP